MMQLYRLVAIRKNQTLPNVVVSEMEDIFIFEIKIRPPMLCNNNSFFRIVANVCSPCIYVKG